MLGVVLAIVAALLGVGWLRVTSTVARRLGAPELPGDRFDEGLWSTPWGREIAGAVALLLMAAVLESVGLHRGTLVAAVAAMIVLAHAGLRIVLNRDRAAEHLADRAWGARGIVLPVPVLQARLIGAMAVFIAVIGGLAACAALVDG